MGLLLSIFAADILPIFLIAGVGFLMARFLGAEVKTVSHIAFYAAAPCLVFRLLVTATKTGSNFGRMIVLAVLIALAMGLVGYGVGTLIRLDRVDLRAFLLVVMFSNGGNYGLPVVQFAFGTEAMTYATVFFLTGSVMTYVVGAFLAAGARQNSRQALGKILQMPNLYAVLIALGVSAMGIRIPDPVMRPVALMADAALPLMILVLGMQLERAAWPKRPKVVLAAVSVSLVMAPLIALALTSLLDVTGAARQAAVALSSMPVAVATTILALEFELAPDFITSTVFLSTLMSPLTLTPLIAYLK
jgi:predicted permease